MPSALSVMVLGTATAADELMPPLSVAGYDPEWRAVATEKAFLNGTRPPHAHSLWQSMKAQFSETAWS